MLHCYDNSFNICIITHNMHVPLDDKATLKTLKILLLMPEKKMLQALNILCMN